MSESVDLYIAFGWVCPECGENQYADSVTFEMSDEEREETLESLGMDADSTGEFHSKPRAVVCKACDSEFEVNHDVSWDEEDEFGDSFSDWDEDDEEETWGVTLDDELEDEFDAGLEEDDADDWDR